MEGLEEFERWLREVCFQKPTPEAYDLAKDAWKEAVNQRAEPQWISVEDRLPGEEQIVLWWNKGTNMIELGSWNYRRGEIITDWMPLDAITRTTKTITQGSK